MTWVLAVPYFALAAGEDVQHCRASGGYGWSRGEAGDESFGDRGGQQGLAGGDRADRFDQPPWLDVLQEESARTAMERGVHVRRVASMASNTGTRMSIRQCGKGGGIGAAHVSKLPAASAPDLEVHRILLTGVSM